MGLDWRQIFENKIVSAKEAVSHIKSGDRVAFGCYMSEPPSLVAALVARSEELKDVEIVHGSSPGPGAYVQPGMEQHFRHNSLYLGGVPRQRRDEGHPVDFTPVFFHQWPKVFREGPLLLDAIICSVTLPDENGDCSFGVDCSYNEPALRFAKLKVVQVNKNMPRTGGAKVNLRDVDFIVEEEAPVYAFDMPVATDIEIQIGENVASLIPDGATLQVGHGGLPNSVLEALRTKNDLGVHSEMLTEKMMNLAIEGVITGKNKSMHVGKIVTTNMFGSRKFYDWIDNNPMVEVYPVDYVNDPFIIGRQTLMHSVNSAIEVDLQGQVNAEMVNGKQFSGIGGQLDYFRGARRSPGGKSIIAISSTAGKGKFSRIVAGLKPGTCITTTRHDIDYIVTEYGVAQIWGKSIRERVEQLINIAHPDFRDQIREEAKKLNIR